MLYIMIKLGFVIMILLWSFSRGCTEGYKWASGVRKLNNTFVCSMLGYGRGILDYHSYRMIEAFTFIASIILAYLMSSMLTLILLLCGSYLFGIYAIYERVLNLIVYNKKYPTKPNYVILKHSIKRSKIREHVFQVVGFLLLILGFLM